MDSHVGDPIIPEWYLTNSLLRSSCSTSAHRESESKHCICIVIGVVSKTAFARFQQVRASADGAKPEPRKGVGSSMAC
jgi:hypothetical protein